MTRSDIEDFNARYAHDLDSGDLQRWPEYFTDSATYRLTSRENYDSGLPGGIIYANGKSMLRDRARLTAEIQYFAPRSFLHMISNTRVLREDSEIHSVSNFMLLETLVDEPTKLHLAGRYHDIFVRSNGSLLLASRDVVYDSNLINSVQLYPV